MRRLVEYVAKSLVDHPEAIQVREVRNDRNVLALELNVAPDDLGKVIGRQGRVAAAPRSQPRGRPAQRPQADARPQAPHRAGARGPGAGAAG